MVDTDEESQQPNDVDAEVTATSDTTADSSKLSSSSKKRGKKNKKSDSPSSQSQTEEPQAKKLRVKPEKVKEVYSKIIAELVKNASMGLMEVPVDVLAAAVGYKNPRSDAILEALKLLKKDGLVEKSKNICKFTELGVKEHVPKDAAPASNEEALKMFWNKFEMKLESSSKTSGGKAKEAAKAIWDLLKDGKAHPEKDVLAVTHYTMVRSTGFQEILKAFKELEYTNGKVNGMIEFNDKVFPLGRP